MLFSLSNFRPTFASLLIVGLLWAVVGCSEEQVPLSADSTGFEVAEEDDSTTDANPDEVADDPSTTSDPSTTDSPSQPVVPSTPHGPTLNGNQDNPPSQPTRPSTLTDDTSSDGFAVPEGSAEELIAFIEQLEEHPPSGRTRDELIAAFAQWSEAMIEACERILAGDATEAQKLVAIKAKIKAMPVLMLTQSDEFSESFSDFANELTDSDDPIHSHLGSVVHLQILISGLASGTSDDPAPFLDALRQVASADEADTFTFDTAEGMVSMLAEMRRTDALVDALEILADALQGNEDEQLAERGHQYQVSVTEMHFQVSVGSVLQEGNFEEIPELVEKIEELLILEPSGRYIDISIQVSEQFEMLGFIEEAIQTNAAAKVALDACDEAEVKEHFGPELEKAERRMGLIGKPLDIAGVQLDGSPIDWEGYRGKVVLIDFWASWCGPCIAEFPNMERAYAKYSDQGFEIIGVNLDDSRSDVNRFLETRPLSWITLLSSDPEAAGFDNPNAVACGVAAIPFIVLVDREGIVVAIHVRGEKLEEELANLFGEGDSDAAADDSSEAPSAEPSEDSTSSHYRPGQSHNVSVVVHGFRQQFLATDKHGLNTDKKRVVGQEQRQFSPGPQSSIAISLNPCFIRVLSVAKETCRERRISCNSFLEDDPESGDEDPQPSAIETVRRNPYLAREGLSEFDLADYLLTMQDRPESIQSRRGFSEAAIEASDRLLDATTNERFLVIAAEAKFHYLHHDSCFGNDESEIQLRQFVDEMEDCEIAAIASHVAFFRLEQKAMETEDLPADELLVVLIELKSFFQDHDLTRRHLRLASESVRIINLLAAEDREEHFQAFGNMFAGSDDPEMVEYGEKIAKSSDDAAPEASPLLGQPVVIEGATIDDSELDWSAYRGNYVIVDFWATWCGPCVREMPRLQELYQEKKDHGLSVVGVSLDEDLEALATFIEDRSVEWPTVAGPDAKALAQRYDVHGIPTMMLIDREGVVLAVAHSVEPLAAQLEALLDDEDEAPAE